MSHSIFRESAGRGRWIRNRGALLSPCDNPHCKRHIESGEWYWREDGWVFCEDCAVQAGVTDA